MEKIDLTKCNNLCVKIHAKYKDYETTGRIVVHGDGSSHIIDDHGGEYIAFIEKDGSLSDGILDFEIVPRDPETYRDWRVGDKVHYPNGDNDIVIFRSGELVVLADDFTEENSDVTAVNTCSQLFDRREGRLVLTDIEQQIIGEKKKYEPQDGDVCYVETRSDHKSIFIYKKSKSKKTSYYVSYGRNVYERKRLLSIAKPDVLCMVTDDCSITFLRPAKDEEQQKLFDAMAKEGKRWNAEKKVVEKISNSPEFKAKEVVMVRDAKERWKLMAFVAIGNGAYKYEVTNGEKFSAYKQCIPYNEKTMHLLGTGEDYRED